MKIIAAMLLFLLAATETRAQTGLPSKGQVDAAMQRSFGYDPDVSWEILEIKPSRIAGLADVTVSMNKQQPVHLYLSADGRQAIVGEIIPFGADPYAETRALLANARGPARGGEAMTLVIFANPDCRDCKVTEAALDQLATDFPQVRQVFQLLPLTTNHIWGRRAALWADCVGRSSPAKFWPFVNRASTFPDDINSDDAEARLGAVSGELGLDRQALSQCASNPTATADLDASLALSRNVGVIEIPTAFVNGRKVPLPAKIPADQLKRLVQFELDHRGR